MVLLVLPELWMLLSIIPLIVQYSMCLKNHIVFQNSLYTLLPSQVCSFLQYSFNMRSNLRPDDLINFALLMGGAIQQFDGNSTPDLCSRQHFSFDRLGNGGIPILFRYFYQLFGAELI